MGMSNMQVQQPMQQSGGKGMGNGIPSQQADINAKMAQQAGMGGMSNPLAGMSNPQAGMPGQQADAQQRMAALAAAQQAQAAGGGEAPGLGGTMDSAKMQQLGGMQGQMGGKGGPQGQFGGKGGMQQPRFGQPNPYPNTMKSWDNASIMPRQGVGKGGQAGGYPIASTNTKYTPPPALAQQPAQQPEPAQQPVQAQQQGPGYGVG